MSRDNSGLICGCAVAAIVLGLCLTGLTVVSWISVLTNFHLNLIRHMLFITEIGAEVASIAIIAGAISDSNSPIIILPIGPIMPGPITPPPGEYRNLQYTIFALSLVAMLVFLGLLFKDPLERIFEKSLEKGAELKDIVVEKTIQLKDTVVEKFEALGCGMRQEEIGAY